MFYKNFCRRGGRGWKSRKTFKIFKKIAYLPALLGRCGQMAASTKMKYRVQKMCKTQMKLLSLLKIFRKMLPSPPKSGVCLCVSLMQAKPLLNIKKLNFLRSYMIVWAKEKCPLLLKIFRKMGSLAAKMAENCFRSRVNMLKYWYLKNFHSWQKC